MTTEDFRAPATEAEWASYHAIRRRVLFELRGNAEAYDPRHPDEHRAGHHPFLLWAEGAPVGVVRVDIEGSIATLRRVAIRDDVQRRGYGRQLLAAAERFARQQGCTRIETHADPGALRFYERCGFTRADPARRGGASVLMGKSLAPSITGSVLAVDLGGVVFLPATEGDPSAAIADRLGVPPALAQTALWHSEDVEAANVGRLTAEGYAARAAERLGVYSTAVLDAIETLYAGRLNEPMVAYLRAAAPTTTIAAVTNNWSFLDRLLARHGIADLFDVVINSSEVGCCKPSVEFFRILLERIGCRAEGVVFVDDDPRNVTAARSLGFRAVHFESPDALAEVDAEVRRALNRRI